MTVRLFAEISPFRRDVQIDIAEEQQNGQLYVLTFHTTYPMNNIAPNWTLVPPGMSAPRSNLSLSVADAQVLFDCLWRGGFRPTDKQDPNLAIEVLKENVAQLLSMNDRLLGAVVRDSQQMQMPPAGTAPRRLPVKTDSGA